MYQITGKLHIQNKILVSDISGFIPDTTMLHLRPQTQTSAFISVDAGCWN